MTANEPTIASSVRGVNHLALVCSDMARTLDFYTGVLGFPLVKTVELPGGRGQHFFFDIGAGSTPGPQRPGAARRQERRHAGLDLSAAERREREGVSYPRTTLAFFWFPDAPASVPGLTHQGRMTDPGGPVSAVASMNHVAFDVPPERIEALRDGLLAAGVECTPIVNHDDSERGASREMHPGVFVGSVYFRDPDDISLELAAWTKVFDDSDVRHAPMSATPVG